MTLIPTNGMTLTQDTTLTPGVYYLPDGITISANHLILDGNGALLVGANRQGRGVRLAGQQGVTIKNLRLCEYQHGIWAADCRDLEIRDCQVFATAETPANTVFLDIWQPASQAYGGGILLSKVIDSRVEGNDLQHQLAGLLTYHCQRLEVKHNNASYCSGFGFHLFGTCDSVYEDNCADYCYRYEPRQARSGHMGADAAGFLIVHGSSRNRFHRNLARLGGDGFFLAGLTPDLTPVPCNNNLFEENDASFSPNIGFEATFSAGNIYRGNFANQCNYGFWLGFSRDGLLEDNIILGCRRAGIATENGVRFKVLHNQIEDDEYGILLWSQHIPEFLNAVPENTTSLDWHIEANRLVRNRTAIRITANQDHGVCPYPVPPGEDTARYRLPARHFIHSNHFEGNILDLQLLHTVETHRAANSFTTPVQEEIL